MNHLNTSHTGKTRVTNIFRQNHHHLGWFISISGEPLQRAQLKENCKKIFNQPVKVVVANGIDRKMKTHHHHRSSRREEKQIKFKMSDRNDHNSGNNKNTRQETTTKKEYKKHPVTRTETDRESYGLLSESWHTKMHTQRHCRGGKLFTFFF